MSPAYTNLSKLDDEDESKRDDLSKFDDDKQEKREKAVDENDTQENSSVLGKIKGFFSSVKNKIVDKEKSNDQKRATKQPSVDILFDTTKIAPSSEKNETEKTVSEVLEEFEKREKDIKTELNDAAEENNRTELNTKLSETAESAVRNILEAAKIEGQNLRQTDKHKRKHLYDYTLKALNDHRTNLEKDSEEKQKMLDQAIKQHNKEINERYGIIRGIQDYLEDFQKRKNERKQILDFVPEGSRGDVSKDTEEKFGNDTETEQAANRALEIAQRKAEYDAANDPDYDETKDYVKSALEDAKRQLEQYLPQQKEQPKKILGIIDKAMELNQSNIAMREEKIRNRFDVAARSKEAVSELENQKADYITAKDSTQDPDEQAAIDEEIKKLNAEIAKRRIAVAKQIRQEREKEEAEEKKEQENKKNKKIEAALAAAKVTKAEKEKEQAATSEAPQPVKENPNVQPTDIGEFHAKEEIQAKAKLTGKQLVRDFLKENRPLHQNVRHNYDYDYDYDDDDDITWRKNENYEKSKEIFKNMNDFGTMSSNIMAYVDYLESEASDNKDAKKVIKQLRADITGSSSRHGPLISQLETKDDDKSLSYILEVDSLVSEWKSHLQWAKNYLNQNEKLSEALQNVINNLHADDLRKATTSYLAGHKVEGKDKNGENKKFYAFVKADDYDFLGRASKNGDQKKITNESCFIAVIRTLINVCTAYKKLDSSSNHTIDAIVSRCEYINDQNKRDYTGSDKIRTISRDLLNEELKDENIRRLSGNDVGGDLSKIASKISSIREIFSDFCSKKIDSRKIERKISDLNNFSSINIGVPDSKSLVRRIYDDDYNDFLQ